MAQAFFHSLGVIDGYRSGKHGAVVSFRCGDMANDLKARGMGQSRMKSDLGDLISGHRSALSRNLSLLMRDLAATPMIQVPQR